MTIKKTKRDIPPIFLNPFLPTEINIDFTSEAYATASMKIDVETWTIFQKYHSERRRIVPPSSLMSNLLFLTLILCGIALGVLYDWGMIPVPILLFLLGWGALCTLVLKIPGYLEKLQEYKEYEACAEAAGRMTEHFQQQVDDEQKSWRVEFLTSTPRLLPPPTVGGYRPTKYCARYQFVRCDNSND